MAQTHQLSALLKVTAAKIDVEDKLLEHYLNKVVKVIGSSDLSKALTEEFVLSVKCLINICSTVQGTSLLKTVLSTQEKREEFTRILATLSLNNSRIHADLASLIIDLISNLTRDPVWISHFGEHFDNKHIRSILSSSSYVQKFLPIVLNLSSLTSVRHSVCSSEQLRKLMGLFSKVDSVPIKILIAGIIKNCSFGDELHCELFNKGVGLLDALLVPLCGPEDCIDKEDRAILPKSVQTITGSPQFSRLFSTELYLTICQTFLQFCSTNHGRTFLRSNGVYFILREVHKYVAKAEEQIQCPETDEAVTNKELLFCIEQVVDQLICEESERDDRYAKSSLREINIDTETKEKLDRVKKDYLECM
ncbi:hypothetical protein Smp_073200.1 [Schistosoma mansoni]|uniref:Protein HGH1 homolog n=1 Tax=Schistosoma mansoni TaxID=6183 RepID=G4VA79_SCHMA|nr:hypothetical protein Smp_073200.1 [Schistosoma mansoni]|eukprot:XP_018648294.1 hypothetical protein Smp_073200.1 [Schistosoma mansoni]